MRIGHMAKQSADVAFYFSDDVIMFAPDGPPVTGKQQVVEFLNGWYKKVDVIEVSHNLIEVVLGADFGYDIAEYTLTFREDSGKVIFEEGHHVVIWRLNDTGEWTILRDMATIVKRIQMQYEPDKGSE